MNISTSFFRRFFFLATFVLAASLAFGQTVNVTDTIRNALKDGLPVYSPKTLFCHIDDTMLFKMLFNVNGHPLITDTVPPGAIKFDKDAGATLRYVVKFLGTYKYHCDNHGSSNGTGMAGTFTAVELGVNDGAPVGVELRQNAPNPVAALTMISFTLAKQSKTRLSLYHLDGSLISELASGSFGEGEHQIRFDASNLAAGTYFYMLTANGGAITKQMVVVK